MRGLKALVIGMGVLILAGLTVVVVTIINRATTPAKSTPSVNLSAPPAAGMQGTTNGPVKTARFGDRRVAIPAGATAEEITTDARRLTIRLRLSSGQAAVLLIDVSSGEKIGLITLEDAGQ